MSNSKGKKRPKDDSNNGNQSSSSSKKRALKQERQSSKKHYTDVSRMKELWNKLRRKDNDEKSIENMMDELMSLLEGKVRDVSMQHDASRVVQAAIQFGNTSQRTVLLNELCPAIPELSKVQYAHFVVLKLITYCAGGDNSISKKKGKKKDKDEASKEKIEIERQRHMIIKAFKGEMPKLAIHAVAARCVELLFGTFPVKETTPLRYELYGPHFVFHLAGSFQLAEASVTVRHISLMTFLSEHPDKREQVLKFVANLLSKGGEKSLYSFAYFQKLYWEYVQSLLLMPGDEQMEKGSVDGKKADDKLIQEGKEKIQKDVAPIVSDHAIQMISSRAGTRVLCECAAYGTPKDRRKILKSLKGYTRSSLLHRDAYLLILRMLDTVDDTVTTNKLLLKEIVVRPDQDVGGGDEKQESPLLELALDNNGSKFFLRLLAPENTSYLDPVESVILAPPTMLDPEGNSVPTTKKEPSIRQKELLGYLKAGVEDLSLQHTVELMKSKAGSKVLREFFLSFPSTRLATEIVDATEKDISAGDENAPKNIFEDPVGHIFLKNVILFEADEASLVAGDANHKIHKCSREKIESYQKSGISFATTLFERYKGALLEKIGFCNRGAFVLEALCRIKSIEHYVKQELAAESSKIEKLGEKQKGYQCLAKVLTKNKAKE